MNEHSDRALDDADLRVALRERADVALAPPYPPDWADVTRRAHARADVRAGRRAPRMLLAAALLAIGIVALAAPFGLAARLYHSVAGSAPPPLKRVNHELAKIRVGPRWPAVRGTLPKLHRPNLVPGTTHLVGSLRLSGDRTARVWAARTRAGGFCFVSAERPFGRSGCSPTMPSEPIWTSFGEFQSYDASGVLRYSFTVVGRIQVPGARAVAIRYRDGGELHAVVSNGWFMAVIPPNRATVAHRKASIVALDAHGGQLARVSIDPPFGKGARAAASERRPTGRMPTGPVRTISRLSLAGARTASMLVATEPNGTLCWRVAITPGDGTPWRCGVTALGVSTAPGGGATRATRRVSYGQFLRHASDGSRIGFAAGWVRSGVARAQIDFQDGRTEILRRGPGFYLVAIPSSTWRAGHRPASIVTYDGGNHELGRISLHPERHCVYPVTDPACGLGRAWWQTP